jgi:hypothetical protein
MPGTDNCRQPAHRARRAARSAPTALFQVKTGRRCVASRSGRRVYKARYMPGPGHRLGSSASRPQPVAPQGAPASSPADRRSPSCMFADLEEAEDSFRTPPARGWSHCWLHSCGMVPGFPRPRGMVRRSLPAGEHRKAGRAVPWPAKFMWNGPGFLGPARSVRGWSHGWLNSSGTVPGFPRPRRGVPISRSIHVERCPSGCSQSSRQTYAGSGQLAGIAKAKAASGHGGVGDRQGLRIGRASRLQAALQVTAAIRLHPLRRYHQQPRCCPCATMAGAAGLPPKPDLPARGLGGRVGPTD